MRQPTFTSSDQERFDEKTEVLPDGCIRWCGSLTREGYGNFSANTRPIHAHRFAYWMEHGQLPEPPLVLDHTCRNRWCVNVEHLEVVPYSVNYWRGDGPTAHREDQTLCRKGLHPWVESNLTMTSGGLTCRTCKNEAQRAAYKRRKAAALLSE